MRVLLDINVILDAMLQRAPWQQDADAVIQAAKRGLIVCSTTAHSLPTIFYVGKKALGRAAARTEVRTYRAYSPNKVMQLRRNIVPPLDVVTSAV